MIYWRRYIYSACLLLLTSAPAVGTADTWSISSRPAQTLLVELYTSEGCSSCPPADTWLSTMKNHPGLFHQFVPVAFHVTYWDYLGWRDTLGHRSHDQRHRRQAASAGSGVYTPGVFLHGREWRGWRRYPEGPTQQNPPEVGVVQATASDNRIEVKFTPAHNLAVDAPRVFLTYLRMDESTQVNAGENRGRKLQHDFIAAPVIAGKLRRQQNGWLATVNAEPPTGADAIAIWITDASGNYLQSAGGYLPQAQTAQPPNRG
ncbi:MAG: DUF1223 domain-containing protein [Pseudomonadota bacterium]